MRIGLRAALLFAAISTLTQVSAAQPAAQAGGLRDRVPAEALAYVRVPGPWALLAAQRGPGIAKALAHKDNMQALEDIRAAMVASFDALEDGARAPLLALLLGHLASPVEAVVLMVPVEQRPRPVALVTATLDLPDHGAVNALLRELEAANPQLSVLSEIQPDGLGVVSYGGMAVALYFDPSTRLLSAVVGTGLSRQAVAGLIALPANPAHPMRAAESRVDDTGLGLFAWVNARKALPFAQFAMPPEKLAQLQRWGLLGAESVSLGLGSANGKGHARLAVEVPRSGLLALLPVVADRVALEAVGEPSLVVLLGGLEPDLFESLAAFLAQNDEPELATELRDGLTELTEALGFSLEEVLGALGPTLVGFADAAGEYAALKIRDPRKLAALLHKMSARENISIDRRKLVGKDIFHMRIRAPAEEATETDPFAKMLLDGSTAHVYWVEDSGYLVFGQVPQALADRYRKRPKQSIDASLQINEGGAVDNAALLLSGRLNGVPRISYYYYLQALQSLSDLAGANVDLFALPSALELRLPQDGALGLSVELSDTTLAVQTSYDATPLDALVVPDASMLAVVGILAAVAIPAYQEYQTKAVVAGTVAATMDSVRRFHVATGQLPGPQAALTAGAMSDHLTALSVDAEGTIVIEFASPPPLAGKQLALRPRLAGGQVSGYSCEGGDLPDRYMPPGC